MDFIDEVRTRSGRFAQRVEQLQNKSATEEATKTSFVLPFIQMLGYDIFDPAEVIPEFTADVGIKKGEKVDYALMKDDAPVILIECKKLETSLSGDAISQLLRYFSVTDACVGVLTDGLRYLFFSDLDQSNVMDPRPFFEFHMLDFTDAQVRQLKRFTKDEFEKSQIVDAARELRYTSEIKQMLARELASPSDEFVGYVIRRMYDGRKSSAVRQMFKGLTYSAFTQFINEKIQDRLENALKQEGGTRNADPRNAIEETTDADFTNAEVGSLNTLKAILGGVVDPRRLALRQNKAYCSVVLHESPQNEDYGWTLFRLWARRLDFVKLSGHDGVELRVAEFEELFVHTDRLRQSVRDKLNITNEPAGNAEQAEENGENEHDDV